MLREGAASAVSFTTFLIARYACLPLGLNGHHHLLAIRALLISKELKNKVGWKHVIKPDGRKALSARQIWTQYFVSVSSHRSCIRGSQAQQVDSVVGLGERMD